MRILFVDVKESKFWDVLGPAYLKSYFEKYSEFKNKIEIDIKHINILQQIKRSGPDIIGMSVITEFYPQAIKTAHEIRMFLPKVIIIIGGYHITNMPGTFDKIFDFGIIGEGEETFKQLIEAIFSYGNDKERMHKIKGIIFFDETNNLYRTDPRDLIPNLDIVPFPYRDRNRIKLCTHIMTSRGCPFNCSFCASSAFWKRTIRYHSAEYVLDEMVELITKYKVRHITIWDDLFIGNIRRIRQIVELMKQEDKIFRSVTFGVSARVDIIVQNEEILELFKRMNVIRISLGFESGSDRILKKLKGDSASLENNQKALALLKKYRFLINSGFIIGSPGETLEDLKATYDFIKNSNLDGGYAGLAIPYPGTKFWSFAKKRGLVSQNLDFSKLRQTTDFKSLQRKDFMLLSKELTKQDIIDYGIKIQEYFAKAELKSFFSSRSLNIKVLQLFIRNPFAFMPFVLRAMFSFLKNINIFSSSDSD